MAEALGINTRTVDLVVFALGSGVAGLAGAALALIAPVTPTVGQSYIVYAFLVVILGGLGSLLGTTLAALLVGVFSAGCADFHQRQHLGRVVTDLRDRVHPVPAARNRVRFARARSRRPEVAARPKLWPAWPSLVDSDLLAPYLCRCLQSVTARPFPGDGHAGDRHRAGMGQCGVSCRLARACSSAWAVTRSRCI